MFRNVSMLAGASAAGQALQLAALLVLTQLYSPAAFGELAIATTASAFFAVFIGLQLPFAIAVTGEASERTAILNVVHVNSFAALAIGLPIAVFTGDSYVLAILIGAGVCIGNAMKALAISRQAQGVIAAYYLWRAAIIVGCQFLAAKLGPSGLAVGLAAGEVIAAALLALQLRARSGSFGHGMLTDYLATIRRNSAFTVYGVGQEAVSICTVLIPFVVADHMFSAAEVGNFGMAYRFIWGPVSIIGVNVGWLFLGALGRSDDRATHLMRSYWTLVGLLAAASAISAASFLLPRVAFSLYDFGTWSLAISLAPVLACGALAFLASVPYRQAIRANRRQRGQLVIDGLTSLAMLALAAMEPAHIAVWVMQISAVIVLQNLSLMIYGSRAFRLTPIENGHAS